jgi:hypothetical protein
MYFRKAPKDEVDLIRLIAQEAIWDILNNEEQLKDDYKKVAYAKALLTRAGYAFTIDEAVEAFKDDDYHENATDSTEDWVMSIVADVAADAKGREDSLTSAHAILATVKALVKRCNFAEIDFAEITKVVTERYNRNQGKPD